MGGSYVGDGVDGILTIRTDKIDHTRWDAMIEPNLEGAKARLQPHQSQSRGRLGGST